MTIADAPAVLLLASKRAYHTDDFLAAAARLGVPCVLGTDRCHVLAELWPEGAQALDFRDPDAAAAAIASHHAARPLAGIVPTDEHTAIIAARAAALLGLPCNPTDAAECAGNKLLLRRRLHAAGLPQPAFLVIPAQPGDAPDVGLDVGPDIGPDIGPDVETDLAAALARAGLAFPVVVKPLHLSASRGVMRADDLTELRQRLARLRALLRDPEVTALDPAAAASILIERFVPGPELAYEGLLTAGALRTLALFDKPDPLDGPFFAETIYVMPSRQPASVQVAVAQAVAAAARAMGLCEGPVHAELRLPPGGAPVVLELAARTIGGLCARTLRLGAGIALEELVIAHATGRDVTALVTRADAAAGVYMLPVLRSGVLRAIHGTDAARAVPGIRDVVITARPGDVLAPLPEGHGYLGFVFAAGPDPGQVTEALRAAVACLELDVASLL